MGPRPGAEYSLALCLLAWGFVAVQIYLYTLTVFPSLHGTHFIFWHALHPVVPLALASAAFHGHWGAAWALVVVVVVVVIEVGYLVVLALEALAAPVAEQFWLLVGSVAFIVTLGLSGVVLLHRIVSLRGDVGVHGSGHGSDYAHRHRPGQGQGHGHHVVAGSHVASGGGGADHRRYYDARSGGAAHHRSIAPTSVP